MASGHSKIITRAAKRALEPLGFRQRNRPRLWIADRGFWLSVVEFTPSKWNKSSGLTVAAHWLWKRPPYILSFDWIDPLRMGHYIEYEDDTQFQPLAEELARQGAEDSARLMSDFKTPAHVADVLQRDRQEYQANPLYGGRSYTGWPLFHLAIATGLAGDIAESQSMLATMRTESDGDYASPGDRLVTEAVEGAVSAVGAGKISSYVAGLIGPARSHYGLPVKRSLTLADLP